MRDYKQDQYVRHLKREEWGFGRVVGASGDYVTISFQGCEDEKKFKVAMAPDFIAVVDPNDVPAGLEFETTNKAKKSKKTKKKAKVTADDVGAKCATCGTRLNRSCYSTDGKWKSCPNCSAAHGTVHVFRPFPAAFGTTSARETDDNPVGIQSYCTACRQEDVEEQNSSDTRMCGDLQTQGKQP